MKVLICGYGRMGKEVEKILHQRGHEIAARVDPAPGLGDQSEITEDLLSGVDAVIEFSLAEGVVDNARMYAASGTPAVVGTTGWTDHVDEVRRLVSQHESAYLRGSNFSIGANLFMTIVAQASAMIQPFGDYDIMVHEYHHKFKKDSPSGTARSIAEKILENLKRKTTVVTDALQREIKPEELHVSSTRGGSIPGIHRVTMDSPADTIEISHSARNRSGFATGAVLAAEWLQGKTGFYTVDDFIDDVLKRGEV